VDAPAVVDAAARRSTTCAREAAMKSDNLGVGVGEAYGKLTEGLHIAGYTFERASTNLEWLLEGDRWQLGGRFADVNKFMDNRTAGITAVVAR
jgi:hypothetical protein